jgi:hypothetical protein
VGKPESKKAIPDYNIYSNTLNPSVVRFLLLLLLFSAKAFKGQTLEPNNDREKMFYYGVIGNIGPIIFA